MRVWNGRALRQFSPTSWMLTFQRANFLLGLIFFLSQHRRVTRGEDVSPGFKELLPSRLYRLLHKWQSSHIGTAHECHLSEFLCWKSWKHLHPPPADCAARVCPVFVCCRSAKGKGGCPHLRAVYIFIFKYLHLKCKCNLAQCLLR